MRTVSHWIGGKPATGTSTPDEPGLEPGHRRAAGRGAAGLHRGRRRRRADRRGRVRVVVGSRRCRSARRCCSRSASWSTRAPSELAEIISDEHGKVLSDAAGEVQRGLEVVEFACGIPTLLKGEFSDQVSTGVDVFSFRQPLGVCVGITPFNFPAMVPMWMYPVAIACGNTFVLKPSASATRRPRSSWPSCGPRPGCPTACSTWCTATRSPSTRCSPTPDVAAISFVGSTPIAKYIHETGLAQRQAGAGARRGQEPRHRAARRRHRLRRRPPRRRRVRLGGRALHGHLGRRRRRAVRPTSWSPP